MTKINDILKNLIIYITYIIILYIIIEQVYNTTIFVFNYNYHYDYGLMLRKICNNEYFEYETERFQLSNNIVNLRLQNDIYNKKNYMILMLFFSIFISIIISYIFSEIFYHNFIENYTCIYYLKNYENDDNAEGIINIIKGIIKCFCPFCEQLLTDCTLAYIIYFFIILLIPVHLILYLVFNIDIGFFSNYNTKIYKIYATIFIFLIILRLPISFFDKYRHINKDSSIYLYMLYIIIYTFIIYFVQNIIKIYNDYNVNNANYDKLTNEEKFYLQCAKNIVENIEDSTYINIFTDIIANIFGFIDMFRNDKDGILGKYISGSGNNIFMNNYSTFLYIIGFIILITYIIYISIFKFKYLEFLIKRPEDYSIIYNFIILPLFSIFIILLLINCNTIYNSYINKYILYEPLALYKMDIDKLYKSFELVLINDKSKLYDKSPVCINVANAIHVVLYATIFNYNISTSQQNIITGLKNKSISPTDNIITKPNFNVDTNSCYNNDNIDKGIDYTKNSLYKIKDQIIYQTQADPAKLSNIFYEKKPPPAYENLGASELPFDSTDKINYEIFQKILKNLYVETDTESIKDKIGNNLKIAIYNTVVLNKNPDGKYYLNATGNKESFYILPSENLSSTNIDMNNKIFKSYNNLINNISDEYISLLKNIKTLLGNIFTDICIADRDGTPASPSTYGSSIEGISGLFVGNDAKLKKYVDDLINNISETFNKINKLITENRLDKEEFSLTKYIISNYNNIHINENYKKDNLIINETNFARSYETANQHFLNAAFKAYEAEKVRFSGSPSGFKEIYVAAAALAARPGATSDQAAAAVTAETAETNYNNSLKKMEAISKLIQVLKTPSKNEYDNKDNDYTNNDDKITKINSNANTVSLGIVIVSCIYLVLLFEPMYV